MDMSQYLGIYLEEARDHLQKISESLVILEGSPKNRSILDEIFRSAHTLKGMSATMGFNRVAELTHKIENILHKFRSGGLEVTPGIMDVLFKCIDTLDNMISDISEGGNGEFSIDHLVDSLNRCTSGGIQEPQPDKAGGTDSACEAERISNIFEFNEFEKSLIREAIDQGYQAYHLVVNIHPRCVMKSARAFIVFKNMEKIGEIIKTFPSVQEIEDENFGNFFELIVISQEPEEVIRKGLTSITEVLEPEISLISGRFQPVRLLPKDTGNPVQKEPAPDMTDSGVNVPKDDTGNKTPPVFNIKPRNSQTVRVDADRLDSLMNLVGELVINKTRMEQIGRSVQLPELNEALEQVGRIASDLQNVVMKVRMIPVDHVFSRFPRMVRDLARDLGKEVEFIIEGRETELDRTVIDEIGDPLVHLLRNSIDHGIEDPKTRAAAGKRELGRVVLSARHEGNNVVIEVRDDGKGFDPELIKNKAIERGLIGAAEGETLDEAALFRLVMLPGFSTARTVTDVSGRGVGLDAVKSKIEALNGTIHIESTPGAGTVFKIQLPLTLAIIQALLVSLGNEVYAIPLSFIVETTSILPEQLDKIQDQEVMLLRGDVLPLLRLHDLLQTPPAGIPQEEEINIVVIRKGNQRVGLIVDNLIGQQEIVIKPIGKLMGSVPYIAGATILGNGQVSLILDVAGLF